MGADTENDRRDEAVVQLKAMLSTMQREVEESCGQKFEWDVTAEQPAVRRTKKRYDLVLWRRPVAGTA